MQQKNKIQNFSISKKLKKENKSNDYFELMLSNISLEDLIALKLEVCFKSVGVPLHGFAIWKSIPYIVKDAMINYSLSVSSSKKETCRFLGISKQDLNKYLNREDVKIFFEEDKGKKNEC